MAQYLLDIFYSLSNCLCCFPGSPQLRINSRSFRMLRLLGEVRLSIFNSCLSVTGIYTRWTHLPLAMML
jgi:hypothetical protein